MEHEIMFTGIGGQGVQLAAQILTRAATLEGREVMFLGIYGGTMRGGNTDSTIVLADHHISSPPMVSHLGFALAMHHGFWPPVEKKLRPGAPVVLNSSVFEAPVDRDEFQVFDVPATEVADDLGSPMAASLVLLAAFVNLTSAVSEAVLIDAMAESLPAYRQAHREVNERALRAGMDLLPPGAFPLWAESDAQVRMS